MRASTDSTRVVLARRRPSKKADPGDKSDSSESSEQDDLEGAANLSALLCSEIWNSLPNLLDMLRDQFAAFTAKQTAIGKPKKTHSKRLGWMLGVTRAYENQVALSLSHGGKAGRGVVPVQGMVLEINSWFNRFIRLYSRSIQRKG